ncbi:unnamed protein product [Choristocarpus tenellus]
MVRSLAVALVVVTYFWTPPAYAFVPVRISLPGSRQLLPGDSLEALSKVARNQCYQRTARARRAVNSSPLQLNRADLSEIKRVTDATPGLQSVGRERVVTRGFPIELSLGAPRHRPGTDGFVTSGGVEVTCEVMDVDDAARSVEELVEALDTRKGVLLSSSYEFPGRYARWTLGFVDPPLELSGSGRNFRVRALNAR